MSTGQSPNKTSLLATKVAELKALCSKHGLTVSGNKNELVNRLLAYFETAKTSSSPQASVNKDLAPSSTSTPATHPTPSNLVKTSEVPQTNKPVEAVQPNHTVHKAPSNQTDPQATTDPKAGPENPIDSEAEKRKQRAERFGLGTQDGKTGAAPNEEDLKKLDRAKRFGISDQLNRALDRPLADGKDAAVIKSAADLEWEARKRKRAEKFGLVDNPPPSNHKDTGFHRKIQKI